MLRVEANESKKSLLGKQKELEESKEALAHQDLQYSQRSTRVKSSYQSELRKLNKKSRILERKLDEAKKLQMMSKGIYVIKPTDEEKAACERKIHTLQSEKTKLLQDRVYNNMNYGWAASRVVCLENEKTKLEDKLILLEEDKRYERAFLRNKSEKLIKAEKKLASCEEKINKALECRICFEKYNNGSESIETMEDRRPVIMPGNCGRTVCRSCAERDRAAKIGDLSGNAKMTHCMFCRCKYHSEKHQFPTNRDLLALL
mmetsp:Transcript_27482/g.79220  ORF Transcript_27482/g.79220 Transcript_27482/m.79220 type:complete len:259 (-) Transcript_27482:108-884(-)